MRRHILGIIGLGFIGVWAYFVIRFGFGDDSQSMAVGILGRAGFTMVAVWLAFPQLEQLAKRVSPWMIFGCVIGFGVIICRPKLFLVVLPLLGVLLAMQFFKWLLRLFPTATRAVRRNHPTDQRSSG